MRDIFIFRFLTSSIIVRDHCVIIYFGIKKSFHSTRMSKIFHQICLFELINLNIYCTHRESLKAIVVFFDVRQLYSETR